jgi:hypothetical protein
MYYNQPVKCTPLRRLPTQIAYDVECFSKEHQLDRTYFEDWLLGILNTVKPEFVTEGFAAGLRESGDSSWAAIPSDSR